jgi:hypothetical protein
MLGKMNMRNESMTIAKSKKRPVSNSPRIKKMRPLGMRIYLLEEEDILQMVLKDRRIKELKATALREGLL